MKQFKITPSSSGYATVQHIETGILVHSAQDPRAEASAVATLVSQSQRRHTLIIGNGLGYLSAALNELHVEHQSVELFEELFELSTDAQVPASATVIRCADNLTSVLNDYPDPSSIIIAPYIWALRNELSPGLKGMLEDLHVVHQSQRVYRRLIDNNIAQNQSALEHIQLLKIEPDNERRIAAAIGSGPTLEASIQHIVDQRDSLVLVAASGALPVLTRFGITPDWIVAMEARDAVLADIEFAVDDSCVVVFPWTHPRIVQETRFNRVLAEESFGLCTNGGSTGLAAADLAQRLTAGAVFLVGLDFSDEAGEYSVGVERVTTNRTIGAAKFKMMRKAANEWTSRFNAGRIHHMVMPGNNALTNAVRLYPIEFPTAVARAKSCPRTIIGSYCD